MLHHDLERSVDCAVRAIDDINRATLLTAIALDCIEADVEDLTNKITALLECSTLYMASAVDELPFRVRQLITMVRELEQAPEPSNQRADLNGRGQP